MAVFNDVRGGNTNRLAATCNDLTTNVMIRLALDELRCRLGVFHAMLRGEPFLSDLCDGPVDYSTQSTPITPLA